MNREDLGALVDQLPMAACLVDAGRIVAANARLGALCGWPPERLLASEDPFTTLLSPEEVGRVVRRHKARLAGESVPDSYDFVGKKPDGTPVPARVRAATFPLAGPEAVILLFDDGGERARTASMIRGFVDVAVAAQKEESPAAIFAVLRDKLRSLGLQPHILEMREKSYRFLGADEELSAEARQIRARWPGWKPMFVDLDLERADQGLFIDDLPAVLERSMQQPVPNAPKTAILASVRVAGVVRYVLSCSGPDFDATMAGALGLVAKHVGVALDNLARLEELRRRNRELAAVNQVAHATATLGSGGALQAALEELKGAIRLDGAALFRQDGGFLRLAGQVGFEGRGIGAAREVPLDDGTPWGEAASSGAAVLFHLDEDGAAGARERRTFTPPGGVSRHSQPLLASANGVALPLQVGEEIIGVLVATRTEPFGEEDLRLASTVAAQAAVGLQNAALLHQTQRRVQELSLLLELGQEVVGALDLQQVLDAGARVAARALRCASAIVFLPEADGASLRIAALDDAEGSPGIRPGLTIPLQRPSLSALAFHTRRPHASSHSNRDERVDRLFAEQFRCSATLAVPLVSHDRSLGVLALIERTERTFSSQDVRLASHAAQLVAAALESAGLYAEQRSRVEEMGRLNAELAHAQKELIARERLAALGELSASIAHEVRNPLGVVFNSLGSLRKLLRPAGDVALLLDIISEEADRLNRMVGDLLDYSRPWQPSLQPVPLRPLIEESLAAARRQAGSAAETVKQRLTLPEALGPLRADARLLRQALLNLFLNALQAMPRGGEIHVQAGPTVLDGAAAAEITIRDTGPGIPAEARSRIWQPFFTTKATGTGLGLAVVRRIVEGHQGEIEVTELATGAEFRLRLPIEG